MPLPGGVTGTAAAPYSRNLPAHTHAPATQDQLVIWMALAGGTSRMLCAEPTLHTRTAMVVAEQLLPGVKFRLTRRQLAAGGGGGADDAGAAAGGPALWMVECDGAGWQCGGVEEAVAPGAAATVGGVA